MTEIPGVKVEFEARVAEAIAKIEELKAAIRSIGNDRNNVIRITDGGSTRRTADNARRDMRRAADDTERDWRSVFRRIQSDNDGALGRMIRDSRRAGSDSARNFRRGAEEEARRAGPNRSLGLAPGGQRANWGALIGLTLPAIAPAAAGLAAPLAGAFEMALPAAASTLAILPVVRDSFAEVTKAASALETQQNKYNAAASRTAIALKTDSTAAQNYAALLQGLNPAERDLVGQLSKQDVSWTSLTKTQQLGAVQLKENKDAYKALSPGQKEALTALIAERAAWMNLNPQQAAALRNYQGMVDTWDKLRDRAQPGVFGAIALAEQAATDALKPMGPLLDQISLGFGDLFRGMDHWFKSDDYKRFIDMWTGDARKNIDTVGSAIGHVALGFIHMWEALHPMMGPSESWLDRFTKKFADWPQTPKGQQQFQNFLHDITTQGPLVWGTLKNVAQAFDKVVAALAGNPLPWLVLKDVTAIMKWIASAPGGDVAINIAAWAFALTRLAQSLKAVAAYEAVMKLINGGGGAAAGAGAANAAAGAAAGAAGGATRTAGLTMLTAAEAQALGITTAGATAGSVSRATPWLSGGAGVGSLAGPIGAILGAGAAMVVAFNTVATNMRNAADKDAGVITHASGVVSAASTDHGVQVSRAFQQLANSYSTAGRSNTATLSKVSEDYRVAIGSYNSVAKKGNDDVKNAMVLGRTEFGQAAGLFAHDFGYNVAQMGAGLKRQGKTLNDTLMTAMDSVFINVGSKSKVYWKGLEDSMTRGMDAFFAKQRQTTKDDYTSLQQATQKLEDDATHGRIANRKKDEAAFLRAAQQYMDDSNKGLISTSSKNIRTLSADLARFMNDLATGNSSAWATDISKLGKDTKGNFSKMADSIGAAASHQYDLEIAKAQSDIARLSQKIAGNILGPLTGHADGGKITGPGTGRSDSIVTRVSNGEYIVNAAATSQHLPLLEAINKKGYANGGLVGTGGEDVNRTFLLWKGWETILANTSKGPLGQAAQYYSIASPGGGGSVQRWAPLVAQVLQLLHAPGNALNAVLTRIGIESGGNPGAINNYDINAQHGDPSRGLMQTIGSTFNTYAGPYRGRGIYDPFANIYAGVNYAMHTYGADWIRVMTRPGGYDEGGILPPGLSAVLNNTRKPEAVLNASQWRAVQSLAENGATFLLHNVVQLDGKTIWENSRRVNLQQQRRNGKSTFSYGTQRIL
ncbi:transglycosylase SLT domain-containing protein [Streptomyces mirabilis]|uniref:transglycosylase SLT domain-containing protein n=1 Tax=Streptomyces mirabilis TaxID=68239 RepID=UPI0036DD7256